MGQAWDATGNVLGTEVGENFKDVIEKLQKHHPEASRMEVKHLGEHSGVAAEMPRYSCHKTVWALKIAALQKDGDYVKMRPADEGYGVIVLDAAFMERHKPEIGGYYVVYADGYKSYSPAAPFESGYTREA